MSEEAIPSDPISLETEEVFDSELLDSVGYRLPSNSDPFLDDPMKLLAQMMGDLKDMAMRPALGILPELPPTEHRVKIFRMDDRTVLADVASQLEFLLNGGWCCHHPTVCNDFLIMDFTRRKDDREEPTE